MNTVSQSPIVEGPLTRSGDPVTFLRMDPGDGAADDLEKIVQRADHAGASDIHVAHDPEGVRVEFRLDGRLMPIVTLSNDNGERLCGRIKYLAQLKTYQESLPQDGRISQFDLNSKHDVRVSTYPTIHGEKIVMRLFNRSILRPLEQLQLPEGASSELKNALSSSSGLILLTGPAGSGKTTTIYSCLRFLTEQAGRHIITVEDPVEQVLSGVMQTEINEARGLTFAVAARHLLRQDPQTLVIGEIRDAETCRVAVQGALTGHQVISTLHTGSCRGVFDRLNLLSDDSYAATTTLSLILNQRLVRIFCKKCVGAGCEDCFETGVRGRVPIAEWFAVNDESRGRLQLEGSQAITPRIDLSEAAAELVERGITNREEVERVIGR